MRILGLDPSLTSTGWGVIEVDGNKIKYVADGIVQTDAKMDLAERLVKLHEGICEIIELYKPDEAAIEEVFLNSNPHSSLKLGQARGVVFLAPAKYNIPVSEYEPNKIKKAVVGVGHAEKTQVQTMIKILLPGCKPKNADSADALAIAICHNNFRKSK
ncbi:MAG: crossover junction endodeoxyribonuclease RuvC [Lactobacillaceae bacterium]|nr:crossover junction endodeoxyribonuclease RuvC [Lactobacillaceae bacterium]